MEVKHQRLFVNKYFLIQNFISRCHYKQKEIILYQTKMIQLNPSQQILQKDQSGRAKTNFEQRQNIFLKSYSDLINNHFNQSSKEKFQLRKKTNSNTKLKEAVRATKRLKQTTSIQKISQTPTKQKKELINQNTSNSHQKSQFSQKIYRRKSQNKFNLSEIFRKTSPALSITSFNPQNNEKIHQMLVSKTFQVQKSSYQNVILNKKLYQNTVQKNDLLGLVENIKLQIMREKKIKSKISSKMAKLMNQLEQNKKQMKKLREEREFIQQQTETTTKEINLQTEKKKQMELVSSTNQQRMNTEKQLILSLQKKIESQKVSFYETKVYCNELKSIYLQQMKLLTNVELNFNQTLTERQKMVHVVQNTVNMTKSTSKY